MPFPTFLIAGAQKSGTSSLSVLVRMHPECHIALQKEVHYFDWYFDRGLDWYSEQFTPQPGQHEIGDATPTYSYYEVARERMIKAFPGARIILILRDPVARAYSHYWHSRRIGYEDSQTFEDAVNQEAARLATGIRKHRIRHSYLDRGRYMQQIDVLESAYGREQLHVLTLDELIDDTQGTLERLFSFLGVEPDQASWILNKQQENRASRGAAPQENRAKPYPPIEPVTRANLVEYFRPFNDRLEAWMGRNLSAWNEG